MDFWIALGIVFFALLFVGMSLPLRDDTESEAASKRVNEG